jgi:methylated-DNA-protein-cysteine methyltransferase-like protein
MGESALYSRIYETVMHIPRGKVATYGQIARLAGISGHARLVGYALHRLPEGSNVPWHRVVNRKGQISLQSDPFAGPLQRSLLESEGVEFDARNAIALNRYLWRNSR